MRFAFVGILISLAAATAFAQTTQPATYPTTQPATDQTPKGTLRMLNIALRDGDAASVRQLFQTGDEQEAKLVAAVADYAAALAALHREAVTTFGNDGANAVTGDTNAESTDGLDAIDKADEAIDGDKATVKYASGGDEPMHLEKVKGQWKLPLSQLVSGSDSAARQRRLEELTHQSKLAQQTAEEIAQGKYKAADDAAHAWQGRLLEAVLASAAQKKGE